VTGLRPRRRGGTSGGQRDKTAGAGADRRRRGHDGAAGVGAGAGRGRQELDGAAGEGADGSGSAEGRPECCGGGDLCGGRSERRCWSNGVSERRRWR
jgi:hypothetical protein